MGRIFKEGHHARDSTIISQPVINQSAWYVLDAQIAANIPLVSRISIDLTSVVSAKGKRSMKDQTKTILSLVSTEYFKLFHKPYEDPDYPQDSRQKHKRFARK